MQTHHTLQLRFQWFARVTVMFFTLTIAAPMATAVEPGGLSVTAEGTTATRAIFHLHPDEKIRNEDHMAMDLIHPEYWHYSVMSDDFKTCMKVHKMLRLNTSYYVNARTKHMDGIVKKAAADGIQQVVNLGAGYDSRAYRFRKAMPEVKFFEIELPEMIKEKKRRLKKVLGEVPDYVAFVPIDFNTQTIPEELIKAGYDENLKTLFIWEGVTYYISGEAVDGTLKFIASRSAPGSSVVFDYLPTDVIKGNFDKYPDLRGLAFWVAHKAEPFVFGFDEGKGPSYVEARGFTVLSDIGADDMNAMYLTGSDGKLVGPAASAFRILHASVSVR